MASRLRTATLVSLGAHVALGFAVREFGGPVAAPAIPQEAYVEIGMQPEPAPVSPIANTQQVAPIPPIPKVRQTTPRSASPKPSASAPAPAAPAGAASDPDPGAPEDLTDATFVVGGASTRAGGAPAGTGTGRAPGLAVPGGGAASDGAGALPSDHSSPVSLSGERWSCPWPAEADTERIDEQAVVIRVVVTPDGRAESAELVSDPGHGFGTAALACALHTRFTPAHDRAGKPLRARSPPIRMRFTR